MMKLQVLALGGALVLGGCSRLERAAQPAAQPAFDVPALIGKDIVEVAGTIGSPADGRLPSEATISAMRAGALAPLWQWTWSEDGWRLTIYFDLRTKRVHDYFLQPTGAQSATRTLSQSEHAQALAAGNLSASSADYSTYLVPTSNRPDAFTGVFITPRPKGKPEVLPTTRG